MHDSTRSSSPASKTSAFSYRSPLCAQPGDVRVRFGHRRTLAAIEAELATVPVEIIGDEATDDAAQIERILTQHAENAHRAALTGRQQLGVVEQLNAFGRSAAQIAKRTKMKRKTVDASIAVVRSDLAKAATERYDFLTLEQAAAVAEFDNDPMPSSSSS
jgi:ParB family chromosome partitioning protein